MLRNILFTLSFFVPAAIVAQDTLKLSAGTILQLTGGVVVTLENMHLDIDEDLLLIAGDGSFRFSGNATTNILGSKMPLFDSITIAKTDNAKLNLQRDISILSGLNFISGLLDLNNNNILLQPTALLNGESETSHTTGLNGGVVQITRTLSDPASENPGNLGAIFTSAQSFGTTIVRRGHIPYPIGGKNSIARYFDIIPTNNTSLNATLRFHYLDGELNGLDESLLGLWKSSDNISWTSIGSDTRNAATNYVEKTGLADFSRFTLNAISGTVPVTFISFNARCNNGKVIVTWKTAQEINSSRFDVERSINGTNWTVLGSVPAAGNSQSTQTYSFTDNNPLSTGGIYRIVEHDIDGRKQYTGVVSTSCDIHEEIKFWPNPVGDIAWLKIYANSDSPVLVQIYDSKGALVAMQKASLSQGNNQMPITVRQLTRGTYQLRVEYQHGNIKTFRLVKL